MKSTLGERGGLNVLLIPLILSVLFFFGALGFGMWAFMSRQDYKDNSDKKSEIAVAAAVDKTKSDKDNEFLLREKEPLREYRGPASLGNIVFKYPKTWSAYVKDSDKEMSLIMHPVEISGNNKNVYALRVEVVNLAYDRVVAALEPSVKSGKLTASPYSPALLADVVGTRVDGELNSSKKGSMVVLPLRDKTIKITTESNEFVNDFNSIILASFTFTP